MEKLLYVNVTKNHEINKKSLIIKYNIEKNISKC